MRRNGGILCALLESGFGCAPAERCVSPWGNEVSSVFWRPLSIVLQRFFLKIKRKSRRNHKRGWKKWQFLNQAELPETVCGVSSGEKTSADFASDRCRKRAVCCSESGGGRSRDHGGACPSRHADGRSHTSLCHAWHCVRGARHGKGRNRRFPHALPALGRCSMHARLAAWGPLPRNRQCGRGRIRSVRDGVPSRHAAGQFLRRRFLAPAKSGRPSSALPRCFFPNLPSEGGEGERCKNACLPGLSWEFFRNCAILSRNFAWIIIPRRWSEKAR